MRDIDGDPFGKQRVVFDLGSKPVERHRVAVIDEEYHMRIADIDRGGIFQSVPAHRHGCGIHGIGDRDPFPVEARRSEEHTSELQSLMRISYAVFCLKKKTQYKT